MRRLGPILLILVCLGVGAGAQDLAFSLAGWSFFQDSPGQPPSGDPGLFASAGAILGLGPRLEAGLSLVPRLSPAPLGDLLAEAHLGYSLFADRTRGAGGPAAYGNLLLEVGCLLGYRGIDAGLTAPELSAFLRLSPVLGNPYYGRRDRILAPGLAYDFSTGQVSVFLNLLGSDFFPARGRGNR